MPSVEGVAVVGGGFMGTGIAESVAVAGVPVVVRDVNEAAVSAARERIESSLQRAVRGGKLQDEAARAVRERIELTTEFDALRGVGLIIEAVPEDERLKLQVMEAIDAVAPPDAIIASNTSSIPIAQLAHAVSSPERVIGMHFFSPVPVMGLVEVVVSLDTRTSTRGCGSAAGIRWAR